MQEDSSRRPLLDPPPSLERVRPEGREGTRDPLQPREIHQKLFAGGPVASVTSLSESGGEAPPPPHVLEIEDQLYYAIADDAEEVTVNKQTVHLRTIDCIRVKHFWETLLAAAEQGKYRDLTNLYNAARQEDVVNRKELLKALLEVPDKEMRRFVLAFAPASEVAALELFAPWRWTGATFGEYLGEVDSKLLDTVLDDVPQAIYLISSHLMDDAVRPGSIVHREIENEVRKLLDEVFSLNHVPDAPLEDGGTTEPPPVPTLPTLVLNEGGFSFEGGDAEFWSSADYANGPIIQLDEESIEEFNGPQKAYCRTSNEIFDINVGAPDVEDGYKLYLYDPKTQRCFEVGIQNDESRGALEVTPVCPPEWMQLGSSEGEKLEHIGPGGKTFESPKKLPSSATVAGRPGSFSPRKSFGQPKSIEDLEQEKENIDPSDKRFASLPLHLQGLKLTKGLVYKRDPTARNLAFELRTL